MGDNRIVLTPAPTVSVFAFQLLSGCVVLSDKNPTRLKTNEVLESSDHAQAERTCVTMSTHPDHTKTTIRNKEHCHKI